MRPGSLALLGIAAYSLFLVATMPARWVAERALPNPGRIALQDVDGTIWHGSANAAVGSTAGTLVVDRVDWRFLPSRLLQARVAYDVAMRGAGFDARAELGRNFGGWTVRDLAAHSNAAVATAILPWTGPWRPEGTIDVTSPTLDIADGQARGALRVDWKDAATALSEVRPLGTYRAEVAAEGPKASVKVSTLAGALKVTGQGALELPGRFAFTGEARGEGEQARALEPLLGLMGPPRPDGARAIDWRTR